MIYCKNCGTGLPDRAKFCVKCGVEIGGDAPPTATTTRLPMQKKKKPIYKRWWFWVLIVILLFAIIPAGNDNDTPAEEAGAEKEPAIEYTVVSVSDMINALEENALNAKETYDGTYVEITGVVEVIDASGRYISLSPDDGTWSVVIVQCFIKNEEQKDFVKTIKQGESVVTVRGKVTDVGEVLGYSLDIDEFVK